MSGNSNNIKADKRNWRSLLFGGRDRRNRVKYDRYGRELDLQSDSRLSGGASQEAAESAESELKTALKGLLSTLKKKKKEAENERDKRAADDKKEEEEKKKKDME